MSREITITVPDEVAEWFENDPLASSHLRHDARQHMTEAAKAKTPRKSTREALAEIGMVYTDEELAQARREMEEARAKMTPELREFARKLLATPPHLLGRTPPADV